MPEKEFVELSSKSNNNFLKSNYIIISLLLICLFSFLMRMIHFPFNVPLNADALFYFLYSVDIIFLGHLPSDWTPVNNGWPVFNSILFSLFQFDSVLSFMNLQRLSSVIFSVFTIIPIFVICKKFVKPKFAIFGAALFGFDPRLAVNSLIGITDPLYIFLGSCGLAFFLQSEKKFVYTSFVLVGLATLVRGEGLFFFLTLSIMFIIKYYKQKKFLITRFPLVVFLFMLIVLPMSVYRLDVDGNDGIFIRTSKSLANISSVASNPESQNFFLFLSNTFELFIQYLGWINIPIFIFFTLIGTYLIFQKRNFQKYTIILSMGIMSLPALVAYSVPALDTRYLYFLFPMFSVLSVLTIHRFLNYRKNQNQIIFSLIIIILIASFLFFEYLEYDYEYESESFLIAQYVVKNTNGVNMYSESSHILTAQIPDKWPFLSSEIESQISIIEPDNFSSLDEFLSVSQSNNISHLVIDDKIQNTSFLYDVFTNESKYPFLQKEYDSTDFDFTYHVKIFRIDYEHYFDS